MPVNEEFEAQYNAEEYEPKIAELMRHAHARLKKENSSSARTWDEAVAELSKGDHYLLVLLDHGPSKWQLLGAGSSTAVFGKTFWEVLGIGLLVLILKVWSYLSTCFTGEIQCPRVSPGQDILFPCSRELLIHDQRIDKTVLGVLKRARQTANNLKAEVAPQFHRSAVGTDHEVELHGAEAAFPGTLHRV